MANIEEVEIDEAPEEEVIEEEVIEDAEDPIEEEETVLEETDEDVVEDEEPDEDEDVISLGEEVINEPDPEEEKAPGWVKGLRKQKKEDARKIKELQAKLEALESKSSQPEETKRRKRPTLDDHEYDSDAYAEDLIAWTKEEAKYESQAERAREAQLAEEKSWQEKIDSYNKKKKNLKVRDYEEVEALALESLNDTQKGIILQGAEDSALLVYAIGKSKGKLEALAKIKDPVKFAFEVAKLETNLKITKRKSAPAPEGKVSGKGGSVKSSSATLDRLTKEAISSGNMDKLLAFQRKQKR